MSEKNCPKCGKEIESTDKFCAYCGYKVEEKQEESMTKEEITEQITPPIINSYRTYARANEDVKDEKTDLKNDNLSNENNIDNNTNSNKQNNNTSTKDNNNDNAIHWIYCSVCGKKLSSEAQMCPNCGHPIKPAQTTTVYNNSGISFWGIVGAIIIAVIIISLG